MMIADHIHRCGCLTDALQRTAGLATGIASNRRWRKRAKVNFAIFATTGAMEAPMCSNG